METPHRAKEDQPMLIIELTKTNRSSCRKCKVTIERGEVRIGRKYAITGHSKLHWGYSWFHCRPDCHYMPISTDEDILAAHGFDQLDEKSKQIVRQVYAPGEETTVPVSDEPVITRVVSGQTWTCPQCDTILHLDKTRQKPRFTIATWKMTCKNCRHVINQPAFNGAFVVSCGMRQCLKTAQLVLDSRGVDVSMHAPSLPCDKCGTSNMHTYLIFREAYAKHHYNTVFKLWQREELKKKKQSASAPPMAPPQQESNKPAKAQ